MESEQDMISRTFAATVIFVFPLLTSAEEVSGKNVVVVESSSWETGENSGYWMVESEGLQLPGQATFEPRAVECHGAGFWDKEGSWGEGICIAGHGDDTLVTSWKMDKGETVGHWAYLNGTGEFAGYQGQGTYTSTTLPGGRQISEWQGEVTSAE